MTLSNLAEGEGAQDHGAGEWPQDAFDLQRKPLLRSVVRDRLAPHLLADIGRAMSDVIEHPLRYRLITIAAFIPAVPGLLSCES